MIILAPSEYYEELAAEASQIVPEAVLVAYTEDDCPVPHLDEADAVLRWRWGKRFSALCAQGPRVRWLHTESAGVDMVLTPEVLARAGLTVTDSGPAYEIAISEWVLGWMFAIARRIDDQRSLQKERRWQGVKQQELHGATVGVVGLGPIGRGVASRARALGMRTLGLRRSQSPVDGVDVVLTGAAGLERLLRESDYVVISAALTDQTRGMISEAPLALMKPSAWIINIARGAMIDEASLIGALASGRIGGACLDVFAKEPLPADSPLWAMPNVFVSPHNSPGDTDGLHERLKAIFYANLRRFVDGEPLLNVVDRDRGY